MNCKHPRLGMSRPGPSDMVSFLRGPNRRLVHLHPPGDRRSFQTFPNPNQLQKIDSKSQHLQPHQAPTRPLPGPTRRYQALRSHLPPCRNVQRFQAQAPRHMIESSLHFQAHTNMLPTQTSQGQRRMKKPIDP